MELMTDIAEQLLAAIAEVESEARLATHGGAGIWTRDTERYGHIEYEPGQVVVYVTRCPTEAQADHIALNDPRSVLRLCEAYREIVNEFRWAKQKALEAHAASAADHHVARDQAVEQTLRWVVKVIASAYGLNQPPGIESPKEGE